MAHAILENMYAGRQSAWHNLGIVDSSMANAKEAVQRGGMDYDIHKMPLSLLTPEGTMIAFNSYGLLRGPTAQDPNYVALGTCGEDYDFWQNREIADRIDLLIEESGWKFSTAGVLGKGETIFICLDLGGTSIAGEDFGKYFTYSETRNGKTNARGFISRVRTVCKNTHDLGLRTASSRIALRHYAEYKLDSDWVLSMVAQAEKAGSDLDAALNALAEIQIGAEQFHAMVEAVAPMPSMPNLLTMPNLTGRMKDKRDRAEYVYNQKVNTVSKTRNAIANIYNSADDIPERLLGTAYHAYQAVTHYTTHVHGTLGDRGRKMSAASRAEWDLMDGGMDMRNAAYTALTEMFD